MKSLPSLGGRGEADRQGRPDINEKTTFSHHFWNPLSVAKAKEIRISQRQVKSLPSLSGRGEADRQGRQDINEKTTFSHHFWTTRSVANAKKLRRTRTSEKTRTTGNELTAIARAQNAHNIKLKMGLSQHMVKSYGHLYLLSILACSLPCTS